MGERRWYRSTNNGRYWAPIDVSPQSPLAASTAAPGSIIDDGCGNLYRWEVDAVTGPVEIAAEAGTTPEGALSYAIGYAERRADGARIAAADVLAGLARLGWTASPACICPAVVSNDGSHLIICPVAAVPAGGAESDG